LTLQLYLVGRRIGRGAVVGLAYVALVLFFGELDAAWSGLRFLFDDTFFYWLLSSHTFLLGLIFFLPALLLLAELLERAGSDRKRDRFGSWLLLVLFFVGCVGAKSYGLVLFGAGVAVFLCLSLLRNRRLSRTALLALGLVGVVDVIANILVFKWSAGGAHAVPWRTVQTMPGVADFASYLSPLWGVSFTPGAFGVPYGTFGLLGIPLVGLFLFARYKARPVTAAELLCLSFFLAGLPALFLLSQPGFSQLFLLFFGLVPGLLIAAEGYVLFWRAQTTTSLGFCALFLAVAAGSVIAAGSVLGVSRVDALEVTLFVVAVVGGLVALRLPRPVAVTVLAAGAIGILLVDTPLLRPSSFSTWKTVAAIGILLAGLLAVTAVARRPVARSGLAGVIAAGCLIFGVLNTPLDWAPQLIQRADAGEPLYDTEYRGLTGGLLQGLHWIRDHTRTSDVLAVNNHSLYPDNHDSKYFYYSAFAERRVALESWDYTAQAAASGLFSLDRAHTPFFRRLTLSNLAFGVGDAHALRALARDYGVDYLVVDKVHGAAVPQLAEKLKQVYSNDDIDVYAMAPVTTSIEVCSSRQQAGIAADFGRRSTPLAAIALRDAARRIGFEGVAVERRGCGDYAVVLRGFDSLSQARSFARQAGAVGLPVQLECRSFPPHGGLNAVFGHRRRHDAAERLKARAQNLGFQGLIVEQDSCGDWEVDLRGLRTRAERESFRAEAARVGLAVTFEPG
jgi:hypothetical protein